MITWSSPLLFLWSHLSPLSLCSFLCNYYGLPAILQTCPLCSPQGPLQLLFLLCSSPGICIVCFLLSTNFCSNVTFPKYTLKMHLSFYKPLPYFYFLLIAFVTILHYITYLYGLLILKYEILEDKDFVWHVYSFISITQKSSWYIIGNEQIFAG